MTARHKLNVAYVAGALIVAGFLGAATQSPVVFVVALTALVALALISGDIRTEAWPRS